MNSRSRECWEKMVEGFEEVVLNEISDGYYDESKIPDLEDLVSQCPYVDLSESLIKYAIEIECHIVENEIENEVETEKNYLEFCFDY